MIHLWSRVIGVGMLAAAWTAAFGSSGSSTGVAGTADDSWFDFSYHIAPILAKNGCAAAECHGGATGRGGFKLSLFATDAEADYEAIVRELGGRRIDFVDPEESLLLKKPTRRLKHGGGRVLSTKSDDFRRLADWIGRAAPFSLGRSWELAELRLRREGDRFRAIATFDDAGEQWVHDVSHHALFSSSNDQVAVVEDDGAFEVIGQGEAWIYGRYGHLSARELLVNPFAHQSEVAKRDDRDGDPSGPRWARLRVHPLDRAWSDRLRQLGLEPGPRAPDSTLVRRLYLDLAGRPPSPDEVLAYEALPGARQVEETVQTLLSSGELVQTFGRRLSDWFEVPPAAEDVRHTSDRNQRLRDGFKQAIERGMALDDMVTELLADGVEGPLFAPHRDPRDRAEFVGRTVLGMSLGCARCHNHPLDRWRQSEHLAFSAFFADPRPLATMDGPETSPRMAMSPKEGDADPGATMLAGAMSRSMARGASVPGKFFLPETGESIPPGLLPVSSRPAPDAAWDQENGWESVLWLLTDGAREQLARNGANRVFGWLTGRTLVSAADDHRLSNPAIHEPVLEVLTRFFLDHDLQLRSLIQFITTSELYAVTSEPIGGGGGGGGGYSAKDPDWEFLARRVSRPMSPDLFKRSVEWVTGVRLEHRSPPDSPLARQLYLMNSGLLHQGLTLEGNQLDALFDFTFDAEQQLHEVYFLVLSRRPTSAEQERFLPYLREAEDPRSVGKQLALALMAGREFNFIR